MPKECCVCVLIRAINIIAVVHAIVLHTDLPLRMRALIPLSARSFDR